MLTCIFSSLFMINSSWENSCEDHLFLCVICMFDQTVILQIEKLSTGCYWGLKGLEKNNHCPVLCNALQRTGQDSSQQKDPGGGGGGGGGTQESFIWTDPSQGLNPYPFIYHF